MINTDTGWPRKKKTLFYQENSFSQRLAYETKRKKIKNIVFVIIILSVASNEYQFDNNDHSWKLISIYYKSSSLRNVFVPLKCIYIYIKLFSGSLGWGRDETSKHQQKKLWIFLLYFFSYLAIFVLKSVHVSGDPLYVQQGLMGHVERGRIPIKEDSKNKFPDNGQWPLRYIILKEIFFFLQRNLKKFLFNI